MTSFPSFSHQRFATSKAEPRTTRENASRNGQETISNKRGGLYQIDGKSLLVMIGTGPQRKVISGNSYLGYSLREPDSFCEIKVSNVFRRPSVGSNSEPV